MGTTESKSRFKVEDRVICTCGGFHCSKNFTIKLITKELIHATDSAGDLMVFNELDVELLVLESIYNSDLYNALK